MPKFLINKDGVYYLTTGRLLEYDRGKAKTPEQRKGVDEVECEFRRIRDEPHTWYESVEVTNDEFGPVNTGQVPGGP